jgi:hypothetical protein
MTTVSDILTRAARSLGYLGRTEVLSAADATDALACFNEMLDSWSNESLTSYVTLQRSFLMLPGQQTYTIGSGGYVNSTRPYDIIQAFVRDNGPNDYPMRVIARAEWDLIGQKTITSQIPDTLFYDSQYPLGVINIFPVPLLSYTVFFNSTTDQVDYSLLSTAIALPVGYELAYIYNLALQMMSFGFPCLLDEKAYMRLVNNAAEAKGNIKRANIKEVVASYDPAIVSRSQATYNIYSDSMPRA